MRILLGLAVAVSSVSAAAVADESSIQLKPGPGMEAVANNCSACHSLDYPVTNAPFLDAKGWDAEVTKMIKVFGAPIDDADAQQIKEYLTNNYGK
ncbi:MAG: cytochrome c [Alsobacter sp.]